MIRDIHSICPYMMSKKVIMFIKLGSSLIKVHLFQFNTLTFLQHCMRLRILVNHWMRVC